MKKPRVYALYFEDEFLGLGTVKELSQKLNITERSLRTYKTEKYQTSTLDKKHYLVDVTDVKDDI